MRGGRGEGRTHANRGKMTQTSPVLTSDTPNQRVRGEHACGSPSGSVAPVGHFAARLMLVELRHQRAGPLPKSCSSRHLSELNQSVRRNDTNSTATSPFTGKFLGLKHAVCLFV